VKQKLGAPKSTYRHNAQIGEYRTILITIIAEPPERFKGFRLAHCQRKAYSLAWGIVPNQSDVYEPKIKIHMRR
jgi:hypothetical protein